MFQKLLIANRGEIARRIIQACRELNIATVAVYSDPDADALHVKEADQAFPLRGIESAETYLDIQKILSIAKESGAQAIHPGYGFLSENASFAEACEKAKIKFIGPRAQALRLLGSKIASKELARKTKVPIIPAYVGAVPPSSLPRGKELEKLADSIGYPLLIKAAAGGGGKGMRIVHSSIDLESAIEGAERESLAFFNDKTLFIEKYLLNPKHIEVQILGDEQGNLVHLFERECSIQRRHQKMIEETPSPSIDEKTRNDICEAALRISQEAHYSSVGTVEFLLDQEGRFYFLEVNTRLQVEHPITEMITGVDLVKEQIRVAAGEKLKFKQSDITRRGHSIECRLYAEDPENEFLPSEGMVGVLHEPIRPAVRIDSALEQGKPILPYYDPMIGKLIVWGLNRNEAIQKMGALLRDYVLLGIHHNLDFLRFVIQSSHFNSGRYHTHSVSQLIDDFKQSRIPWIKKMGPLSPLIAAKSIKQVFSSSQNQSNDLQMLEGFRNA